MTSPENPNTDKEAEARTRGHTPGEWEPILRDDIRGQPVPYYSGLICLVQCDGEKYLAVVTKDGSRVSPEAWADNTKLLASAPTLLAERDALLDALKRANRIIGWMMPYIGNMCPPENGIAELNDHCFECHVPLPGEDTKGSPLNQGHIRFSTGKGDVTMSKLLGLRAVARAAKILLVTNPVFRIRPVGGEGSLARRAQDDAIEAEDELRAALAKAERP